MGQWDRWDRGEMGQGGTLWRSLGVGAADFRGWHGLC